MSFETRVTGKWILAGEHAVLRGCPALVFPLYSRFLTLEYFVPDHSSEDLKLELAGNHGDEHRLLFWGVVQKACELKSISRNQLKGRVRLSSTIPVGAGLGASAALSVAISRWFQAMGFSHEDEQYDFAVQLENLFHGESSGVDIAVAMSGQGLRFVRNGERRLFAPAWKPRWYVSYSGQRGVTLECVNKVKAFLKSNAGMAEKIDMDMRRSVELAEQALATDESCGMKLLKESIDLGHECFSRWGLISGIPENHLQWLRQKGALAAKPTGSGDGGYVLSLWDSEPSPEVAEKLISCF